MLRPTVAEPTDEELLAELGVTLEPKKKASRTPREERVIAGFEDILKFVETHGRPPIHGEDRDIFERIYAVRLDRLRAQADCRELLGSLDTHGLLAGESPDETTETIDDEELLAELGAALEGEDLSKLRHVKPRAEVRAAEEIANRKICEDFDRFKPLFAAVRRDIETGLRQTRRFGRDAEIKQGNFFIVGGQVAHVAEAGEEIRMAYGRPDRRLRVIYDNGTESDILLRSLQRALYKDEAGRRITDASAGPLFGEIADDEDLPSGTVYVLRSKSEDPTIAAHREVLHKIGVTGGKVETRIANAALDATYLMADVDIVATYTLFNINRVRLERLFHRVFANARLDITITDRLGNPIRPREWFLVPLHVIDEVVAKVADGTITEYEYEPVSASLRRLA
jgi:hypothetical protein